MGGAAHDERTRRDRRIGWEACAGRDGTGSQDLKQFSLQLFFSVLARTNWGPNAVASELLTVYNR